MYEETVVLENRLPELVKLQGAVADFGARHGLPQKVVNDINLVLEETIVNIIYYAYEDKDGKHEISVRFRVGKGGIILEVEDDGIFFDPLGFPEPDLNSPIEKRKIGGLGIHLIRKFAKSVSHRRERGKNILTLTMS